MSSPLRRGGVMASPGGSMTTATTGSRPRRCRIGRGSGATYVQKRLICARLPSCADRLSATPIRRSGRSPASVRDLQRGRAGDAGQPRGVGRLLRPGRRGASDPLRRAGVARAGPAGLRAPAAGAGIPGVSGLERGEIGQQPQRVQLTLRQGQTCPSGLSGSSGPSPRQRRDSPSRRRPSSPPGLPRVKIRRRRYGRPWPCTRTRSRSGTRSPAAFAMNREDHERKIAADMRGHPMQSLDVRAVRERAFCRLLSASACACLPGRMDVDALVVREGDRATATGRLIRNDRGDWFEPVLMIAEPGGLERRIRAVWKGAVWWQAQTSMLWQAASRKTARWRAGPP